jgi:hypothetical protein
LQGESEDSSPAFGALLQNRLQTITWLQVPALPSRLANRPRVFLVCSLSGHRQGRRSLKVIWPIKIQQPWRHEDLKDENRLFCTVICTTSGVLLDLVWNNVEKPGDLCLVFF